MTLLSIFALLLSRLSQQTDIVIGSPIANHIHSQIESLIGFFVNTLVLRIDLTNNPGTIVDLFQAQVEKTPENIAVVFEEQQLTYQ